MTLTSVCFQGGRGRPKRNAAAAEESDSHEDNKDTSTMETEEQPKADVADGKPDEAPVENNVHADDKEEVANNNGEIEKVSW